MILDEPPADAIDIGNGMRIQFADYQGEAAGINEWHRRSDGGWCRGWVAFHGSRWAEQFKSGDVGWKLVQRDPLTLTPSIKCRACGNHGHITNGRWVPC